MMKLVRGSHVVLGITDDNLVDLATGRVIRVLSEEIGMEPGKVLYIMYGNSHEEMQAELIEHGYAQLLDPANNEE